MPRLRGRKGGDDYSLVDELHSDGGDEEDGDGDEDELL